MSFGAYWDRERARNQMVRELGICFISRDRDRIRVVCPHNSIFAARAGALGGRYRPRTSSWRFRWEQWDKAVQLCSEVFGSNVRIEAGSVLEEGSNG